MDDYEDDKEEQDRNRRRLTKLSRTHHVLGFFIKRKYIYIYMYLYICMNRNQQVTNRNQQVTKKNKTKKNKTKMKKT